MTIKKTTAIAMSAGLLFVAAGCNSVHKAKSGCGSTEIKESPLLSPYTVTDGDTVFEIKPIAGLNGGNLVVANEGMYSVTGEMQKGKEPRQKFFVTVAVHKENGRVQMTPNASTMIFYKPDKTTRVITEITDNVSIVEVARDRKQSVRGVVHLDSGKVDTYSCRYNGDTPSCEAMPVPIHGDIVKQTKQYKRVLLRGTFDRLSVALANWRRPNGRSMIAPRSQVEEKALIEMKKDDFKTSGIPWPDSPQQATSKQKLLKDYMNN